MPLDSTEISVIIPTYNGAHKLKNILGALEKQNLKGFEVIVAVDGSTDSSVKLLNEWQAENYHLQYCCQENRGRAAIRNFGAKQARGSLLVFFDDDMRPTSTTLAQHLRHHTEYPGTLVTAKVIEEEADALTDVQKYKFHLSRKWYEPLEHIFRQSSSKLFFTAANCSLSAKDFWMLRGFDERLTDAEDYDFGMRAVKAGKEVFFLKDAVAYHDDFITAKSYLNRLKQYRNAHQMLKALYPEVRGKRNRPNFLKLFAYRMFAFPFWIELIESEFLTCLPIKLRYRLYDVIFFSLSEYYYKVPLK